MIPVSLISLGSKLVNSVLDRVLPAKMDEKQKLEIRLEAERETQKILLEGLAQEIADTASARELAKAELRQAPKSIRILRGLVRPLVGLFCALVWGWTVLAPYFGCARIELSNLDYSILLSVFAFYFGLRTAEKMKDTANRG